MCWYTACIPLPQFDGFMALPAVFMEFDGLGDSSNIDDA